MSGPIASDTEVKEEAWRAQLRGMNERFESRLDESVFDGVRDEKIHHGLRITSSTVLQKTFVDICFCDETKEYLLLEKGIAVQRYSLQGKLLLPAYTLSNSSSQLAFVRMIWCDGAKCLVCYDPNAEQIWILNSSCASLVTIKNEFLTKAIYYEPLANEIIAIDSHQSLKYSLDELKEDMESTKALTYIDPESGPTWQLDRTTLISRNESRFATQLVGSYSTSLYILPLERDEEEEDTSGPVVYSLRRANATKAPICSLHFHAESSWILAGDQQGAVTAWNLELECVMSHPGAHETRVAGFLDHPSMCGFLSYSHNKEAGSRLQVWSCNFRDKLEAYEDLGEALGIALVEMAASIVLLTPIKLYFFAMRQAYYLFAPLTSQAKSLMSVYNPMYSTKLVVASKDNSVRIFSAYGKQLNVQILPEDGLEVVTAIYSGNQNELFTIILKSGEILVSDTTSCPMKFKHVIVNDGPAISCVTIYEYYDEIRDYDGNSRKPQIFCFNNVRMIVGTVDGSLITIDVATGNREAVQKAHIGRVKHLKSFVTSQRVISLGIDKCVKVWRMLADLNEPLALYYTLNFTIPIAYISAIGLVLCMASSSENSKAHQVLMEDMKARKVLDHHYSKDHEGPITDMITSETLKICATSSVDKTIRVWDNENCLLKILEINYCVKIISFSSNLGDIVFSAGRHLYQIPHVNYLSPKYRAKIAIEELSKEENEDSTTENEEYRIYENIVDRNLMLHPVLSIPLGSLDMTNSAKPRPDILIKKQICALFEHRDEDIQKIKDSLVDPASTVENRSLMTADVWDKYVNDLLNSMTRTVPEIPAYDFESLTKEQLEKKITYNERGVFQMLYGYSIDEVKEPENLHELIQSSKLPLRGFLPNTLLYKEKEKVVEPVYVEKEPIIKREPVKYKYPREFYPDEDDDDDDRRVSISLSQLMVDTGGPTERAEEEEEVD